MLGAFGAMHRFHIFSSSSGSAAGSQGVAKHLPGRKLHPGEQALPKAKCAGQRQAVRHGRTWCGAANASA
eukprot:15431375-Alexandrium_andersonii.AAC.1